MGRFRFKSPLLDVTELNNLIASETVCLFDCRFQLFDTELGRQEYDNDHIPGARYLHLDDDLSGPIAPGSSAVGAGGRASGAPVPSTVGAGGRHPLPEREYFLSRLTSHGWTPDCLVVAYDASGGPYASRLWWLMKWFGFHRVLVLQGGWQAWLDHQSASLAQNSPLENPSSSAEDMVAAFQFDATLPTRTTVDNIESSSESCLLVDSRTHDRYLGQNETIDPVAGHIPGAVNLPWTDNLDERGRFLPAHTLKARFNDVYSGSAAPTFYCGSGVTACHNVLATQIAGLPMPSIYAESWSGWISNPNHPIETD